MLVTEHAPSAREWAVGVTLSSTDDELLTAGGADGFAVFYRRHVDAILRYHARSTRNAEVAADLAAETFAAALEAKHRFKPGGPPQRSPRRSEEQHV